MTTEWVVSAGTERVRLTRSGTEAQPGPSVGEIVFTITNPGPVEDRVVFEIVPGQGADKSWFTVDNHLRSIPAGQSVDCLVTIRVPVGTPAGSFSAQARLYPPDTAPEESSRLYGRFTGEIGPTQQVRTKPWWLLAVVGLVIITGGVVAWLALRPDAEPAPKPSPTKIAAVEVPDLTGATENEARKSLAVAGLKLGALKFRHRADTEPMVVSQSIPARSTVKPGSSVDVVIVVNLTAPVLASPANQTQLQFGSVSPELTWNKVPNASAYNVRREREVCGNADCVYQPLSNDNVSAISWKPSAEPPGSEWGRPSGWVRWQVTPLDDFKDPGTPSAYFYYQIPNVVIVR